MVLAPYDERTCNGESTIKSIIGYTDSYNYSYPFT